MLTGLFTIAPFFGSAKYTLGPPVDAGGELEVQATLAARPANRMRARRIRIKTPFEEASGIIASFGVPTTP
jgi:hypothetical protein